MGIDLEALSLDLPEEHFTAVEGVSRLWRVVAISLFLGLGVLGYLYLFAAPPQSQTGIAIRVKAVGYAVANKAEAFTAGGWIEPAWPNPVTLSARVEGVLEELSVPEGADVGKDQELATLDTHSYEAEVAAAQAMLRVAQAREQEVVARLSRLKAGARPEEIKIANAVRKRMAANFSRLAAGYRVEDIAQARARLEEARIQLNYLAAVVRRNQGLLQNGGFALGKIERDEADYQGQLRRVDAAEAELARLRAGYLPSEVEEARASFEEADLKIALLRAGARPQEIEEADAGVRAARAEVERAQADLDAAEWRLSCCSIKSPFAGRVLEIHARPGAVLSGETRAVITIYDPAEMYVRVDVRQEQAAQLKIGQPCVIKLVARKDVPYEGELVRIDPLANLARDTVRAKVRISEPDDNLRKDMTVTVDFLAAEDEEEVAPEQRPLVLPRAALTRRDGKDFVFVIRGGKARLTPVELGDNAAGGVTVKAGVSIGDLVAVSNLPMLDDGIAVRLEAEVQS